MIIFEWRDYDLIGVLPSADSIQVHFLDSCTKDLGSCELQREYICDQETIENNWCNTNQTGQFILSANATDLSKNEIFTQAVHLANPGFPIHYGIKKTGYYCVGTTGFTPVGVEYTATVEFRNAYGELPAAQIAKLPFYGGITIVYAVIAAYVGLLAHPCALLITLT